MRHVFAFGLLVVVLLIAALLSPVTAQLPPNPPTATPVHMSVLWDESVTVPMALTTAAVPSTMPGITYRLDRLRTTLVKIDDVCYLWMSETPSETATALQILTQPCPAAPAP